MVGTPRQRPIGATRPSDHARARAGGAALAEEEAGANSFFVDRTGYAPPELSLRPPIVIPKEAIEEETARPAAARG